MPGDIRKIDGAFSAAYDAWQKNREAAPDAGISVNLLFKGDIRQIEALGFEAHAIFGDQAMGVIRFKDYPTIAADENVLWIASGRRDRAHLDVAVPDIKARASNPVIGPPVDGLWHADINNPVLTSVPKGTGKGVIVAIIDTGIDYTHPMFLSQLSPAKTRILKIWDQGLTPSAISDCPDRRFLGSADTYGVEYDSAKIEAALNGGTPIDHRDCDGHGSHVAGIAAGGIIFTPLVGDASKVGVAPEADIIAVKYIDVPDKIFFKKQDGSVGAEVGWSARYRDAVLYCLRSARELNKAIVINMSFGDDAEAGDALDGDARWTDSLMDPTAVADNNHFPKGAVVTKAAGNEASPTSLLINIVVPASGETVVPLKLIDQHLTQTKWRQCSQQFYAPTLDAHFWYRRPSAPLAVQFAVQLPNNTQFSADVSAGGKLQLGINPIVGPPPNDIAVGFDEKKHGVTIDHQLIPPVPHPAGGTVARSYVEFSVTPNQSAGTVAYHQGTYKLRIRAPAGTVIFGFGDLKVWGRGLAILRLEVENPLPPEITSPIESSMFDSGGQHILTVASYMDKDFVDMSSKVLLSPAHSISDFSSRGPLRDFSDPPRPPFCNKPDIAAPGETGGDGIAGFGGNGINSAESIFAEGQGILHWLWALLGARFQEMSGTSMASPMVAGVVALMLEKNPNLNITQVRTALSSAPRAPVEPAMPPAATNAYGVGMVDALTAHTNTPP